jgi:hypothetical protein
MYSFMVGALGYLLWGRRSSQAAHALNLLQRMGMSARLGLCLSLPPYCLTLRDPASGIGRFAQML